MNKGREVIAIPFLSFDDLAITKSFETKVDSAVSALPEIP